MEQKKINVSKHITVNREAATGDNDAAEGFILACKISIKRDLMFELSKYIDFNHHYEIYTNYDLNFVEDYENPEKSYVDATAEATFHEIRKE